MPAEADVAAPIRMFLVDDHQMVRSGVVAYLEAVDGIEVIGEATDGRQALDRLAGLEARGDLPDLVLMDLLLPIMDGITATGQIKSRWPAVEVVALTSFAEEAKLRGALEAGAAGYLLKDRRCRPSRPGHPGCGLGAYGPRSGSRPAPGRLAAPAPTPGRDPDSHAGRPVGGARRLGFGLRGAQLKGSTPSVICPREPATQVVAKDRHTADATACVPGSQ